MKAKFICNSVTIRGKGNRELTIPPEPTAETFVPLGDRFSETGYLTPVVGAENAPWSNLTPAGSLSITITNPNLFGQFEPGKRYDIDITEEAKEESAPLSPSPALVARTAPASALMPPKEK